MQTCLDRHSKSNCEGRSWRQLAGLERCGIGLLSHSCLLPECSQQQLRQSRTHMLALPRTTKPPLTSMYASSMMSLSSMNTLHARD